MKTVSSKREVVLYESVRDGTFAGQYCWADGERAGGGRRAAGERKGWQAGERASGKREGGRVSGRADGRADGLTSGRVGGRTDGRMGGRMDGRMGGGGGRPGEISLTSCAGHVVAMVTVYTVTWLVLTQSKVASNDDFISSLPSCVYKQSSCRPYASLCPSLCLSVCLCICPSVRLTDRPVVSSCDRQTSCVYKQLLCSIRLSLCENYTSVCMSVCLLCMLVSLAVWYPIAL